MKRRARIDSVTAAVGDVAGALRRRREGRVPTVRLIDATGEITTLDPDSAPARSLIEAATALIDASEVARRRAPRREQERGEAPS